MGDAQSIPVIGEAVTVVESGIKIVAAGSCALVGEICDDQAAKDAAKKLTKSAGKSWVEYSEKNVIAAPTRALVHSVRGNEGEADRVMKKMGNSVEKVIDNTPVVGHAKGVYHYLDGDTERGHACMKGASRTAAVAGAGVLTGGAGVAAAKCAAVSSGLAFDATVSVIDSAVKKEPCFYGVTNSVGNVVESLSERDFKGAIGSTWDVASTCLGDATLGDYSATAYKSGVRKMLKRKAVDDVKSSIKRSCLEVGKESIKIRPTRRGLMKRFES